MPASLRDCIEVKNLRIEAIIGVNESERVTSQPIVIMLSMYTDVGQTAAQDALASTFNYSTVTKAVSAFVGSSAFFTLEALTVALARLLCVDLGVERATVRVEKPEALRKKGADCAAVELTRCRGDFGLADTYGAVSDAAAAVAPPPPPNTTRAAAAAASGGVAEEQHEVFVGLGSNLGNRPGHIEGGLQALESQCGCRILHTSLLYETPAAYVVDQPPFLNAVAKVSTALSPLELLRRLKQSEQELGRPADGGVRWGPRNIDLDILLYGSAVIQSEELTIPHPRLAERGFVLGPLCDIAPGVVHPTLRRTAEALLHSLEHTDLSPVLPFATVGATLRYAESSLFMGVVNVTPDSFSDGGRYSKTDDAVEHALSLLAQGAHIVDVGGESTRPGATELSVQEELDRVLPVIEALRKRAPDALISIDTYKAAVAKEAVARGASMVNDISGGTLDSAMLTTVAELNVPYVISHLVGNPRTMNSHASYAATPVPEGLASPLRDGGSYRGSGVVAAVANFWSTRFSKALEAGVRRWNIVLDPGLGFAKTAQHNLELLQQLPRLRRVPGTVGYLFAPAILIGASRKGFIRKALDVDAANTGRLDAGTSGACVAAVVNGANMLRVHSVEAVRDAVAVADQVTQFKGDGEGK